MNTLMLIIAAGGSTAPPKGVVGHLGYWAGPIYSTAFLVSFARIVTDAIRGRRDAARAEWRELEDEHRIRLKALSKSMRRKANVADKRK